MRDDLSSAILSVFFGRVGTLLIGALTTPVLARLLSENEFGTYAVMISVVSVLTGTFATGLFKGIRRYISETRCINYWKEYVLSYYLLLLLILIAFQVTIFALLLELNILPQILPGMGFLGYSSIFLWVILKQLYLVLRNSHMGLSNESISESLNVFKSVAYGTLSISLVYLGFSVQGIVAAQITSLTLMSILGIYYLNKYLDLKKIISEIADRKREKSMRNYSIQSALLTISTISVYHSDVLLLQYFIGGDVTGYYKSALITAEYIWIAPIALQTVLIQSTSNLWSSNNYQEISQFASKIFRLNTLLTGLLVIGMYFLSEEFISIYFGSKYRPSVTPLIILLPGVFGYGVARPLISIGEGKSSFRAVLLATGLAAMINILLNLILIPRYGINGAALATSISYFSMLIFHLRVAYVINYNPLIDLRLSRVVITFIITIIFTGIASNLFDSTIYSLFFASLCGLVSFVITIILIGAVDIEKHDLTDLKLF